MIAVYSCASVPTSTECEPTPTLTVRGGGDDARGSGHHSTGSCDTDADADADHATPASLDTLRERCDAITGDVLPSPSPLPSLCCALTPRPW
jgi:hypothetical protein